MSVFQHRRSTIARGSSLLMVLSLAVLSACTCPQAGSGRSGRANGQDPSGGSFAFFGSLRSFFAESPSSDAGCRSCTDADLESEAATTSASTAGTRAGEASLSIR